VSPFAMTTNENTPINDTVNMQNTPQNTPVSNASHEDESPAGRGGISLSNLMGPLTNWLSNVTSPKPAPVNARRSPEVTPRSDEEPSSSPQNNELNQESSHQDDQPIRSDAEFSEAESLADDSDEEGYEFSYADDDDDVSLDDETFFGVTPTKPGQPSEEQLEAIRKTLEEDENKEAIERALREEPNPTALPKLVEPPHPLLRDQNYNAKEMLISIRSSYRGDVMHVIGLTEPLFELKLKFIQELNLPLEELQSLEFWCGHHVIKDDDTAEKVCCSLNCYCTKVAHMAVARVGTRIDCVLQEDWTFAL
jgi:hypothetical protein